MRLFHQMRNSRIQEDSKVLGVNTVNVSVQHLCSVHGRLIINSAETDFN